MAEHKHQQQDLRAGQQHLAHLQQDSVQPQAQVLHQHQVGAQPQLQQEALVAVQALEQQRLRQQ
jgi:hypothetical protein